MLRVKAASLYPPVVDDALGSEELDMRILVTGGCLWTLFISYSAAGDASPAVDRIVLLAAAKCS